MAMPKVFTFEVSKFGVTISLGRGKRAHNHFIPHSALELWSEQGRQLSRDAYVYFSEGDHIIPLAGLSEWRAARYAVTRASPVPKPLKSEHVSRDTPPHESYCSVCHRTLSKCGCVNDDTPGRVGKDTGQVTPSLDAQLDRSPLARKNLKSWPSGAGRARRTRR